MRWKDRVHYNRLRSKFANRPMISTSHYYITDLSDYCFSYFSLSFYLSTKEGGDSSNNNANNPTPPLLYCPTVSESDSDNAASGVKSVDNIQ